MQIKIDCPDCGGSGRSPFDPDERCNLCGGTGLVDKPEEEMTPTQRRIVDYLDLNPDSPTKTIMQNLGIALITTQRALKALHDNGLIHISSYQKTYKSGAGSASPAYSLGNNPDARKRSLNKETMHQARLERQRNRRRLERVKGQANSPLGLMIAQLTLEKRV